MAQALQAGSPGNFEAQLAALGVRPDYLYHAIEADEQARRLVTPNDPPTAAGTEGYNRRVRTLREDLIQHESWKRANLNGLPVVVNPEQTIAIGVLLGDHTTGWPGNYHPRNLRPIGNGKVKLIAQNAAVQPPLFARPAPPEEADLEGHDLSGLETWFFITYRRAKANIIRVSSELSLPCQVSDDGYVEKYAIRIPLPVREFGGVISYIPGQDDGPDEYEVDVDER